MHQALILPPFSYKISLHPLLQKQDRLRPPFWSCFVLLLLPALMKLTLMGSSGWPAFIGRSCLLLRSSCFAKLSLMTGFASAVKSAQEEEMLLVPVWGVDEFRQLGLGVWPLVSISMHLIAEFYFPSKNSCRDLAGPTIRGAGSV